MSSEITPMKRLSSIMAEFRSYVKPHFSEVNLNKSSPKHNPYAWRDDVKPTSKGVENDFVMIFSNSYIAPSFAFSFTFLGLPLEKQRVEVTIKKDDSNNSIMSSGELTVEEFKIKLKEMIYSFQEKAYTSKRDDTAIIENVSKIFLTQVYDLRGEITQATKNIAKVREQKRKEYDIENLETNVVTTTNNYGSAEKKAEKVISNSKEKAEVDRLQDLLIEAKKELNNKVIEVETKYKLEELKEEKNVAKVDFLEASENMNKAVQLEIDKLPGIVGRKMKR